MDKKIEIGKKYITEDNEICHIVASPPWDDDVFIGCIQGKKAIGQWGAYGYSYSGKLGDTLAEEYKEPKYVPFKTSKELADIVGRKVIHKESDMVSIITDYDNSYVNDYSLKINNIGWTADECFDKFTFADGTPCGKLDD